MKEKKFSNEQGEKNKKNRFSFKKRLLGYKNIPKFFVLIWQTHSPLTFANVILRLVQAIMPIAILNIGKRIIDQVVLITHKNNTSHLVLWKLVCAEFLLILTITILS